MDTKKAVIPVKGMTCVNCAAAIQKDISKLVGVKSANVNYANEKAVVEFDPDAVGLDKFISSINELGYQAVTETVTIPIIDLDASRVRELEGIVTSIDGVLKAVVNAGAETVEVEYIPGQIGLRDIRRTIEKAGFRLPQQAEGRSALDIEKEAREKELSQLRTKLITSAVLSVLVMLGSFQDMLPIPAIVPNRTMWFTGPVLGGPALLPERLGVDQARQHEHEHPGGRGDHRRLRLQRGAHLLSRGPRALRKPRRRLL
jgi:Cu+-exporting ATPase